MFDTPVFTLDDVRTIRKDVSVQIDDFTQYAVEAQRNYLSKLLGDKLYTALIAAPAEARFVDLLDGKIYQDGGRDVIFRGLKTYLSYVWLYLYSVGSSSSLTATGPRIFKDDLAIEAYNRKEARDNTAHFKNSADGFDESILRFLTRNRVTYPEFTESFQIKQASNDNFQFRSVGRTYRAPNNVIK